MLGHRACADPLRRGGGFLARELDGVAGEEDVDLMTIVERRASDQQAERGTGRIFGPCRDVNQEPRHRRKRRVGT
jgi:hypothetical protein